MVFLHRFNSFDTRLKRLKIKERKKEDNYIQKIRGNTIENTKKNMAADEMVEEVMLSKRPRKKQKNKKTSEINIRNCI